MFTAQWLPKDKEPSALVFLLHGYAVDCGLFFEGESPFPCNWAASSVRFLELPASFLANRLGNRFLSWEHLPGQEEALHHFLVLRSPSTPWEGASMGALFIREAIGSGEDTCGTSTFSFIGYDSDTGTRLAKAGYAAYGIDYEGHGRSDGLHGLVPSMDKLVEDVGAYFKTIWGAFPTR